MVRVPSLIALFACASSSLAWGPEGHATVGSLADKHLAGTRAETEMRKLLRPGETLARMGSWADRIKGGGFDAESKDYIEKNPDHGGYHYTDIPFNAAAYRPYLVGARPEDLIQMYARCIKILRGTATPGENPTGITPRVALLLLAHFAGDLEQPLHVGAAYIATIQGREEFVDPTGMAPGTYAESRGGNELLVGPANLHSCWDSVYTQRAMQRATGGTSAEIFAAWLLATLKPQRAWAGKGEPETWPMQWANDILPLCRMAHEGIRLGPRLRVPSTSSATGFKSQWRTQLPSSHERTALTVIPEQLAKGGWRLAQVLLAVWPDKKPLAPVAPVSATPTPVTAVAPTSSPALAPVPVDRTPGNIAALEARARRRALVHYPELGVAGSPFNRAFLERRARYQKENPEYFRDPEWPWILAGECAANQMP